MPVEKTNEQLKLEREAAGRIEERNIAWSDAKLTGKQPSAEASRQWAEQDIRDYRSLSDDRRGMVADFIAENAAANSHYKATLEQSRDVAREVAMLDERNRELIAQKELRKADDAQMMRAPGGAEAGRYGFTDPRDGTVGVQYSFRTQQEAEVAAEKVGLSRFQGHGAGGETVQFYRDHEGQWRQAQNEAEIGRNQNPERFAAMRGEHVDRLMRAGEEGLQVAKAPLSPELRQAFADMGVNPQRDRDERLQGGIEVRTEQLRQYGADLPAADVKRWADLDARSLEAIQDPQMRRDAAAVVAGNALSNDEYRKSFEAGHRGMAAEVAAEIGRRDRATDTPELQTALAREHVALHRQAGENPAERERWEQAMKSGVDGAGSAYRVELVKLDQDLAQKAGVHVEKAQPDTTYTGRIAGEASGKVIQEREGSNAVVIHDRQAIANDVSKHAGKSAEIRYVGDVGLVREAPREAGASLTRDRMGREERAGERER